MFNNLNSRGVRKITAFLLALIMACTSFGGVTGVSSVSAAAESEPASPTDIGAVPASGETEAEEEEPILGAAPMMMMLGAGNPDTSGGNGTGEEDRTLQEMIEAELKSSNLQDPISIRLKKNVTYTDPVTIEKDSSKTYGSGFAIEIETEDAGDDGLQAEGSTKLTGALNINGINMVLRGLVVSGKISVEKAQLDFYGTKMDDSVDITAGKESTVNLNLGAGKDKATISSEGGNVTVEGGAGSDTLTADMTGGTMTLNGGADDDKITADAVGGTLNIDSGAGDDNVTAVLSSGNTAHISSGDGDDKVQVTAASAGKTEIDTAAGADTVTLDVRTGAADITVQTGSGGDQVTIGNTDEKAASNPTAKVNVQMGEGMDMASVDMSAADSVSEVNIEGGADGDRVHFTGTLKAPDDKLPSAQKAAYSPISGDASSLKLTGENQTLTVNMTDVETLTDRLDNKRTVKLSASESTGKIDYTAKDPFTNYIIVAPSDKLQNILIRPEGDESLLLSTVVIDTPSTFAGKSKLSIGKDAVVDVRGLQLLIQGQDIEIDGTLMADLIQIEAADGTGVYKRSFADRYNEYNTILPGAAGNIAGAAVAVAGMAADSINIKDSATVTIGKDAKLYSAGDVLISAKVEQRGGMISFLDGVNLVNVKLANADVTLESGSQIYAGYDFAKKAVGTGYGNVKISAEAITSIGYDKDGKAEYGLPLAVSVGIVNAGVRIQEGATVTASKSITAESKATLKASTRADSGLFGAPAAVAVAVLLNNAKTDVRGTLNARGGSVKVLAEGNLEAETTAEKGEGHEMLSGGFAAVTVALQDVSATIDQGAAVTASGAVTVQSTAKEKVENKAVASQPKSEDGEAPVAVKILNELSDALKETLGPVLAEEWFPDSLREKTQKAVEKIAATGHSAVLDDDADRYGTVELTDTASDSSVSYRVNIKPWTGYKVKSVTWRGYNPGDKEYHTGKATRVKENSYTFNPADTAAGKAYANVVVFVEYEEGEEDDGYSASDLFEEKKQDSDLDLATLLEDVNDGTDDGNESTRALNQLEELDIVRLDLGHDETENGVILTYETEENDGKTCLKSAAAGDEVRLIVNPASGYKLKEGTLKATYTVKADDQTTEIKTVVISPDSRGRYILTVPTGIEEDGNGRKSILLSAEFEGGEDSQKADTTQTQVTGTVAVVVSDNDNVALINAGASVKAGSVSVLAEETTSVANTADGSSAGKPSEDKDGKKDDEDYAIKRAESEAYSGFDATGYEYALTLETTDNGKVTYEKGGNRQTYVFTAVPDAGYSVGSATIVYYSEGKGKTARLTAGSDGKYTVYLASPGYAIDKGTVTQVFFTFTKNNAAGEAVASRPSIAIVPNAILITYNGLKQENTLVDVKTGSVLFKEYGSDKEGAYYKFAVTPNTARGYQLDGTLKAYWTDLSGKKHEIELKQKDGEDKSFWFLNPEGIPAGALITVNAAFKAEMHEFSAEKAANGEIKLYDKEVTSADKPKFTVKPNAGYSLTDIVVKVGNTTYKLSDTNSKITKARDNDGKEIDDMYTFTVPMMGGSGKVTINATFQAKSIKIYNGATADSKDVQVSANFAAPGDKITVTPNDAKAKEGYKVTTVKAVDETGKTIYDGSGDSFTIPKDSSGKEVTVTATLGLKAVKLQDAAPEHGKISPAAAYADRGEKVTVTVEPDDNFMVKEGSLKAVVQANDHSYSEEVLLSRRNDTTYFFTVPSAIKDPSKVTVTFKGEFEPGQSNSSEVNTSVGAGIAVTVANGENRAEIKGMVESAGKVDVKATLSGGAKTESKAGYSKGNTGIGGAVSVQVASLDSKALLHKTADVKMDGILSLTASSELAFSVNADASGKNEASGTGVGAGIAVAVNGSDAYAAVADGVKLAAKSSDKNIRSILVNATQKVTDSVTAKAGAAGGTAAVPVAAVDITGSTAVAYMGKVLSGMLKIGEENANTATVSVSATNKSSHTVSADASAAGKGAGVGAAFAVDVVSDKAEAKLNQGVDAYQVTVAASSESKLTETATASASGGKKESKKDTDKQADGLLGTGTKLAQKNGNSGMDAGKAQGAINDRQKAETAEGTVGVAGAVAVNVQFSETRAEILDSADIKAADKISVTSENVTVSNVKANASTTNSDVGVGVGVAVNVVFLDNIARIGNGSIEAASLTVSAITKETPPEKTISSGKKAETESELLKELGDAIRGYVTDLLKEYGLDKYVDEELLGDITAKVASEVVGLLLDKTGLKDLFGNGNFKSVVEKAANGAGNALDGLLSLPELLLEPLMGILDEVIDMSQLSADEAKALGQLILDNLTAEIKSGLTASGKKILSAVKDGMLEYLEKNMGSIVGGVVSGDVKTQLKLAFKEAGSIILKTAKKELLGVVKDAVKNVMDTVGVQFSAIGTEYTGRIVEAFTPGNNASRDSVMDTILSGVATHFTTTFKNNVFDYEKMLTTLTDGELGTKVKDTLLSAVKTAGVTLTNEVMGALTGKLGLVLEAPEEKATGHIISTQAIAGAGARKTGVAGSLAVTVLNSDTRAEIADSGKDMNVSGDVKVEANEKRTVKNAASAAVDANGNASDNKAGESAGKDTGGGNDAGLKVSAAHMSMETAAGASLSIRAADKEDGKPRVQITVKEGYKLPEKDGKAYATYTYTDKNDFEVTGTVALRRNSDGSYVLDPRSGELSVLDDDMDVRLELKPEEVLHTISGLDTLTAGDVDLEEGAVSVGVKDREVKDGKISAHAGETVEIRVAREKGRKILSVSYSYTDKDGNSKDVENIPASSSNSKEAIYSFNMPEGNVTAIVVAFEKSDSEEEPEAETASRDATGKTVGVGAAFSMIYGNSDVTAAIGSRKSLTAGALKVNALSTHKENIIGVAGSDPLEEAPTEENMKDVSVDASIALNILDNDVKASVGTMAEVQSGDLTVTAAESTVTETKASAFAVGSKTAVGATVAVNLSFSEVDSTLAKGANVSSGSAAITAESHSEDVTTAMSTAMGADIARSLAKLGQGTDNIKEKAKKLLDGSYIGGNKDGDEGKEETRKPTDTGKMISSRMNRKKADDGDQADENASVSTNILRTMGVKAARDDSGSEGTDEARDTIGDKLGKNINVGTSKAPRKPEEGTEGTGGSGGSDDKEDEDDKYQVAAAVGVTVNQHIANVKIGGDLTTGGSISAAARNTGNFNTTGTGAAMSLADHANSISAGVAVSVNRNEANVLVEGDLVGAQGTDDTVDITSTLTQNMDGDFAGKLAAQSLAGSVSGEDSEISLAGALSVVVSMGKSTVRITGGSEKDTRRIEGGKVTIEATDKSKTAARAGGLSLSKGSSVGMGIGSTTIISLNEIRAEVGDYAEITAGSFKLNAEKKAVTFDDYKNLVDMRYLVTDSSKLSEDQRKNADTGLIDIHKGDDDEHYSLDVNLSGEKLLAAVDGLNVLSSQNVYAEAIAGSMMSDGGDEDSDASIAGSIAVVVSDNDITAKLGSNAKVRLNKDNEHSGDMTVNAANGTTARIIAGSLSAAPSKLSVGATIAVLVSSDEILASTGNGLDAELSGDFTQNAETTGDIQLFTAAASVASGENAENSIGGAINVIVTKNQADSKIGDSAGITAGGKAEVTGRSALDLMAISGSASVNAGENATAAAGGTVNVIVDRTRASVKLGKDVKIETTNNLNIFSDVSDQMISGTASLSAAPSGGGDAGAGVVNVIVSGSAAETTVDSGAKLNAKAGDLAVKANNDAWMLNASVALAGASGTALGAAFNVNVFNRTSAVHMADGIVNAGGNLAMQSSGRDTSIMAGLSVSGSKDDDALSGTAVVMVENNTVETVISKGIDATAAKNALIESFFSDFTVGAAGNIAASMGGSAYGATIVTAVKNNTVQTSLGDSSVTGSSGNTESVKNLNGEAVKGIYVGSNAAETQFFGGAGIAGASEDAFNGEVVVLVNSNTVLADASESSLTAESGDIKVTANDDTTQTLLAGGITIGGGNAVGAAVVTLVSNKDIQARAYNMNANAGIEVSAGNSDDITMLALSIGGSGESAVQIGAAVQVLKSQAVAKVGYEPKDDEAETEAVQDEEEKAGNVVTAGTGNFVLKAENNTKLINIAAAVAAAAGGSAVTPVGAITYFQGTADATLLSGSTVDVKRGNIDITAKSDKNISLYTLGISAGSGMGLSGAANILVSKDKTHAGAETGSTLKAPAGNLNVDAKGNYKLRAISGAVGLGPEAVGINAVVSVLKSNITAELGGNTTVGRSVNVTASGNLDVINAAASIAAGSYSGGITVMVLVAGAKMSQDAADMVAYGNSDSKESKDGFDPAAFMENAQKAGIDMNAINEGEKDDDRKLSGSILEGDLAGNGHRESEEAAGARDEETGESTFDGASGYRSDEIDTLDNDTANESNRGEDQKGDDTADITKAKAMNTYTYANPTDAVIARILNDTQVKANSVKVDASQTVAADMIGAAIAVGQAGAGVSTVVAILHSNVSASSMGDIMNATGGVTVSARSRSGKLEGDHDAASRDATVMDLMSNKPVGENASDAEKAKAAEEKKANEASLADKLTSRSIRTFGLSVGAGMVGVAVAVSVVLTDNVTQAILGGTVTNSGEVNVTADHNYKSVMAATGSLAVGSVGAGASVAVAQAEGTVKALIADETGVSTRPGKSVNVSTNTNVNADAIAVTAGAGLVSVNAGLAMSFNRLTQETGIGGGSAISSGKDINVSATSTTTANSYLLGVSVGGVAVTLNSAVSNVTANINTHIGNDQADSIISAENGNITVTNEISSSAIPKALSVAAGGVAVGGNVLLAFNETKANASIERAAVTTNDLTVTSDLSGTATSSLATLQVGAIAVGLSVNYADMRADNRAAVVDSALTVAENMTVQTGAGKDNSTLAEADTISANMGAITLGINTAIARNKTKNYAVLTGKKDIHVTGDLTVESKGDSTAIATIKGVSVSGIDVAVSAIVALNDADASSLVDVSKLTTGGTASFNATQTGVTTTDMLTGGGSLLSLKVSAAIAYGQTRSIIDLKVKGDADLGGLHSSNNASDTVTSRIGNLSIDGISAAARFGAAYSKDDYVTTIVLSGRKTEIGAGGVNVLNDYTIQSIAEVTPSLGGVDISLGSLAINSAIAKNTGKAGASFEAIKGTAHVAGDVDVKTLGSASTDAKVNTAKISLGGISLGANIAKADLSMTQFAYLRVGGTLTVDGDATIESLANSAVANAKIGTSGGDAGLDLKLANLDVSRAISRENMTSTAAVLGGPIGEDFEYETVDNGAFETVKVGYFDYEVLKEGAHIVRNEETGEAETENVTILIYSATEYEMYNALNEKIFSNLNPEIQGERTPIRRQIRKDNKVRFGQYYEWIEEEETRWVEKREKVPIPVDLYNADENKLIAANLKIVSGTAEGTKTGSTARTDGALTIGIMTAGALDAKALSTDSFSVVFEGTTATITGTATLKAYTDTIATAVGMMPGGLTLADAGTSEVTAQVGQRKDKQTVSVIIGRGNSLTAGAIDISASNIGQAKVEMHQGSSYSLGSVKKTSQPTESWYNTLITIGRDATVKATSGDLKITSTDAPSAASLVSAVNKSLTLNFNSMMGRNSIDQENNIDIGSGAKVTATAGEIDIQVKQSTVADAETIANGGGVLEGSVAKAQNDITRVARINIGDNATIQTEGTGKALTMKTVSGENDDIHTYAFVGSDGVIALGNAKAYTNLKAYSEIVIGQGITIDGTGNVTLDARSTSFNAKNAKRAGIRTEAEVDSAALIPLPDSVARNNLQFNTYVDINQDDQNTGAARAETTIKSGGTVLVNASNDGLTAYARTSSKGAGAGGISNATSWNAATLTNAVWIDDAKLTGADILIYAENGGEWKSKDDNSKAHFISESYAKLAGIGSTAADSRITGVMINQIRTNRINSVIFDATGSEVHKTSSPYDTIWQEAKVDTSVKKILGIKLASENKTTVLEWYYFNRCDFCGEGTEYDVKRTDQMSMDKRYDDAFEKALSPITDIHRTVASPTTVNKARYGEEDNRKAGAIYVLGDENKVLLGRDVRLSMEEISRYMLWSNTQTDLTVTLLPNSARMYRNSAGRLQYVIDVFHGDLFGSGRTLDIEVITALTENAFTNPVIPVGSTGSLDLSNGTLVLPDQADYELFLHEVSGNWMRKMLDDGFIQMLNANQEEIDSCALNGTKLPQGNILHGLTEGDETEDGSRIYWVGITPDQAEDPDQQLVFLLIDEETDEVDAFRTTRSMIEAGEEPVDVSLYLYRDSKSDRMGEERYNVMFFDTPEGQESLVKVITNVMAGRTLEMPLPMRIVLRGRYVEGADKPVYTLTDHVFILCNGTDGEVDTLDGFYQATFDGDVFSSAYTYIEGIRDGNMAVIIRKDQPIWMEWTGENTAEDISGIRYRLNESGEWEEIPEDTTVQADTEKTEDAA